MPCSWQSPVTREYIWQGPLSKTFVAIIVGYRKKLFHCFCIHPRHRLQLHCKTKKFTWSWQHPKGFLLLCATKSDYLEYSFFLTATFLLLTLRLLGLLWHWYCMPEWYRLLIDTLGPCKDWEPKGNHGSRVLIIIGLAHWCWSVGDNFVGLFSLFCRPYFRHTVVKIGCVC